MANAPFIKVGQPAWNLDRIATVLPIPPWTGNVPTSIELYERIVDTSGTPDATITDPTLVEKFWTFWTSQYGAVDVEQLNL